MKLSEWKQNELNRLLMEKFNFGKVKEEKEEELEEEKEELEEGHGCGCQEKHLGQSHEEFTGHEGCVEPQGAF